MSHGGMSTSCNSPYLPTVHKEKIKTFAAHNRKCVCNKMTAVGHKAAFN